MTWNNKLFYVLDIGKDVAYTFVLTFMWMACVLYFGYNGYQSQGRILFYTGIVLILLVMATSPKVKRSCGVKKAEK